MQEAEVSRMVRRLMEAAGLPVATVTAMLRRSARVGVAQDLVANDADLASAVRAERRKIVTNASAASLAAAGERWDGRAFLSEWEA